MPEEGLEPGDLVARADRLSVQLGVAGGGAGEVAEGGNHPQRLLDDRRHEGRVLQDLASLVGVLHERSHPAAVRLLGAVVAGTTRRPRATRVLLRPT